MTARTSDGRLFFRSLCIVLAMVMAIAPSASVIAQTNAAAQAVRQRVQPLTPSDSPPSDYGSERTPGAATLASDSSVSQIDTNFVLPTASAVLVLRPAQILTSPMAEMLPKEVATAAGTQFVGFDPAEVEELVAFVDISNPVAPSFSITVKFVNPFRATAIPFERRAHTKLAELGGKKYLQSSVPAPLYSLYGPNNKTLVIAPDDTLRRLVESIGQPKTGPLVDRVQSAPAGSDLYLAVDAAALRPLIQMSLASYQAQLPPDTKPLLDAINLVTAAELTINVSNDGPISLVLHANDEAAAQQLETLFLEARAKSEQAAQMVAAGNPVQMAMTQYKQRVSQPFTPQRNGATITWFRIDNQTPAHKQLISAFLMGAGAVAVPAMQAARLAAMRSQPGGQAGEQLPPLEPPAPTESTGESFSSETPAQ